MDATTLKQILIEEMQGYTGAGLNAYSYLTENDAEQIYTVIDIATIRDKRLVSTVLIARLLDNRIVIELDHNNKELVDALKARGVPDDQIIMANRGDKIPALASTFPAPISNGFEVRANVQTTPIGPCHLHKPVHFMRRLQRF